MTFHQAKTILTKRREALGRRLGFTTTPELERGIGDDESAEQSNRTVMFASRGHLIAELQRIDEALDRIHEGVWGLCTSCQGPIAAARLRNSPEAERCLICQVAFEQQQARAEQRDSPQRSDEEEC